MCHDGLPRTVPVPRGVWVAVMAVASAFAAFSFSANHLWMSPEARGYVVLAGGIAERFDFSHDLFLVRTPGYPLLLAGVFWLFGENSPIALQAIQHILVVMTTVLAAAIAWHLTAMRSVALLTGLLSAVGVPLWAFANMVMSEVPFTFASTAALFAVVRFGQTGCVRSLALASAFVGLSYLFRQIGIALILVLASAIVVRVMQDLRALRNPNLQAKAANHGGGFRLGIIKQVLFTLGPACIVAGPWITFMALRDDNLEASFGPTLFARMVTVDKLDSTQSAAWLEIKGVVEEAKRTGHIPAGNDLRREGTVVAAYAALNRGSYAHVCRRMQQAGLDLLCEHYGQVIHRSFRYGLWTLMVPDTSYRFLPGGAAGERIHSGLWGRAQGQEVFDCATYEPMMRALIGSYEAYLPLRRDVRITTPLWESFVRAFYRWMETGPGLGGFLSSPYAMYVFFGLLGACRSLFSRNRATCWSVAFAVVLQAAGSAALTGPLPRYAVPCQPLLAVFVALALVSLFRGLRALGWPFHALKSDVQTPQLA